jgi:hypothetical protein
VIRVEIIANHSVEENILEALKDEGAGKFYTKYPGVFGIGSAGPRMGDAIWPEENFALVIWCEEEEAQAIERAVNKVKAKFPDEGIKLFAMHPDPSYGSAQGAAKPAESQTAPSAPPPPEPPPVMGLSNLA